MSRHIEGESDPLTDIAEPSLIPDQPISSLGQDHLERGGVATGLARQFKSYHDDKCLVVAFYAPWGAGKSSLLNLLANELASETEPSALAPIIIRFNPWNFSSLDSLLSMFFRELRAGAGRVESKLAKNVQKSFQALSIILAAGEISPVAGSSFGGLSRLFRRGAEALEEKTESLVIVKERTNMELRQLNRRIFVLIDDIDRLDQESMRFMFRLIRLNADFDHMSYVLAFDRDVVASALTQEQGVSGSEYLGSLLNNRHPAGGRWIARILGDVQPCNGRRDNVPLGRGQSLRKGGCKSDHPPPSIVFKRNTTGGVEDVQGGDVRAGKTGLYGRGDGYTGSSERVRAAPGHGKEDAPVFSAAGVQAEKACPQA